MILKRILFIALFLAITTLRAFSSEIYIYATINNEIITNHDIKKEQEYLKILNPDLAKLDDKKLFLIGKNALINQIIKKKEISKIFDLQKENPLLDKVFKDMYTNLNFKSENQFNNSLQKKNNYTTDEVRDKLKIEVYWNDLIFKKYRKLVKIDKKALIKKIKTQKNNFVNEYLLSEIFFNKKKEKNLNDQIENIKQSIIEIGFNNTANIYSVSESAKYGGKIGWINENNLSELIYDELRKKEMGQYTDVIQISNNFLILKIEDKRSKEILIDEEKQLDELLIYERNRQLTQFSSIYFNKVKINYSINEK